MRCWDQDAMILGTKLRWIGRWLWRGCILASIALLLATASACAYLSVKDRAVGVTARQSIKFLNPPLNGWQDGCLLYAKEVECLWRIKDTPNNKRTFSVSGFAVFVRPLQRTGTVVGLRIGTPYLLALFAILPSLALLSRLLPKKPGPGHCPCGYDLTGNVSGVCPECGTGI